MKNSPFTIQDMGDMLYVTDTKTGKPVDLFTMAIMNMDKIAHMFMVARMAMLGVTRRDELGNMV